MPWLTPRAWASLELMTSGNMNTYVSDLLSYLKGSVGTVAIDSAMTISGNTVWNAGNDGSGSGLDADLLDGLQSASAATGSTIAARNSGGWLFAAYFNAPADDRGTALPTKIAGQDGGDNYYRWYNETNWQRDGGLVRQSGSYDLGQANAATKTGRKVDVHADGGALTVSATGSVNIVDGTTTVSSKVISSGDTLTFRADGANNQWVIS